ncbi:uncharacterized protein LOC119684262 [Teleopsis dalmanni]|uniref:uncharacterized protein LOC119684262 n=1 Tax=Teleopsis dalmanni TaxID=139649 RepID=UPI0018CD45C7|nr:uncharacterized protein LOC119684262 [Teleopsis dalmanni]
MLRYQLGFIVDGKIFLKIVISALTKIDIGLLGIISADIYLKLKVNNKGQFYKRVFKYVLGCWICFMISYILLHIDYNSDNYTMRLLKLMTSQYKIFLFWPMVMLAFSMKLGGFIRNILSSNYMQTKARLSYPAYLWHVVVMRIVMNYQRQPIYINFLTLFLYSFLVNSLTNIVAVITTLVFEYPIAEIFHSFIGIPPKATKNLKSK